jgi:hypothetical protein
VEAFACEFAVDFVEAFGFGKIVFFPEFLDYASAGFGAWQWGWSFDCLGEVCVF